MALKSTSLALQASATPSQLPARGDQGIRTPLFCVQGRRVTAVTRPPWNGRRGSNPLHLLGRQRRYRLRHDRMMLRLDGGSRTPGLLVPNQARYQLRHIQSAAEARVERALTGPKPVGLPLADSAIEAPPRFERG